MKQNNSYLAVTGIVLAYIAILSFWVMYGVISYYNRFAADDYSMIALVNHKGIWGGTIWFYNNWSGGIFCTLFENITVFFLQNSVSLLGYNYFLLLLISSSLVFLVYELVTFYGLSISLSTIFIVTQLFIQALFFSCFSISENWFWVIGSNAYVYPLCVIFISAAFFIRYQRIFSVPSFVFSLITVFILGSWPINYTFVFATAVFAIVCYQYYKSKVFSWASALYMLFIVAGTGIYVLAPGNYKRLAYQKILMAKEHHYSFAYQLSYIPLHIFQSLVFTKLIFVLALAIPIAYMLFELLESGSMKLNRNTMLKALAAFFALFIFALLSNTAILYKAYGWGMSSRTMLHLNIFFILFFICSVLLIFSQVIKRKSFIFYLPLCICIYLNIKTLINQYPVVAKYAKAHDDRTQVIKQASLNYKGELLLLDPLPPSGIFMSAEMDRDTLNYVNVDMKSRFDLPFALAVK